VDTLSYKTLSVNKETADKQWVLVDATDQILGRMASQVAMILRGKKKPSFTPNADCGDNVIIINCEKIQMTGKKMTDKVYMHYTGYPGGQRYVNIKDVMAKDPTKIVEEAVRGMLPKNRLGAKLLDNLYLYVGPEHKHEAQQPKLINLNKE
jgi:large subunit ribosomal protein L13